VVHLREAIRSATVALLTGLPDTGANVFSDRDLAAQPLIDTELPAIAVRTADERVIELGFGGPAGPQHLECDLEVDVFVKSSSGAEALADSIGGDVQVALANAVRIAGAVVQRYDGTEVPRPDASTEQPVAARTVRFVLAYIVAGNNPTVAL
jgi:hypothetical protein